MAEEAKSQSALDKFSEVARENNYAEQAQFYLNAMWAEHGDSAEDLWTLTQYFSELDKTGGASGHSLDEFESHRLLEKMGQTLTVVKMRQVLKEIDVDSDNRMSMLEYLVWANKTDIAELMKRPQGTNEELKAAQKALKAVQDEIAKIETEKTKLEAESEAGGVKGLRAKAALAQLLDADQLPLRKAVVTAGAAVRKAQKSDKLAAQGQVWWMGRELEEAKKYKPRGGIKKAAIFSG